MEKEGENTRKKSKKRYRAINLALPQRMKSPLDFRNDPLHADYYIRIAPNQLAVCRELESEYCFKVQKKSCVRFDQEKNVCTICPDI